MDVNVLPSINKVSVLYFILYMYFTLTTLFYKKCFWRLGDITYIHVF